MKDRLAWLIVFVAVGQAAAQLEPPKHEGKCSAAGCHENLVQPKVVHQPVGAESCDGCHEKQDDGPHAFKLANDQPALCTECHDEFSGKSVHQPLAAGPCTGCHEPHSSDHAALLVSPQKELCGECHEDLTENLAHVHGPVSAGDCTVCHEPHASPHHALLRTAGPKLCTDCHGELAERFEQAKHVHPPVKDDCTVCHPPHGAANEALLKALQPALCLECHDGIGELMTSAIHKHSPLANDASCAACHDPHASAVGGLLLKPSMDLCLSCHNREIPHGSEQVANIGETLATRANHHGPIRQEDCGSCHEPHGGAHANLLKKGFPDRFYVSYTDEAYALCFECHEVEAFTEQETDSATGFRNGSQNLHYLHVNQSPKGRSCRVCHDPHATTGTKLVMESVPFGKWQVPIRFRETATGGSCGPGCHRAYRYERGEAALNIPPR